MPSEAPEFHTLAARFADLPPADRKAVLAKLDAEDRTRVMAKIASCAEEIAAEEERERRIDRQFVGYSPWLAETLEVCLDGRATSAGLTPRAARSLCAHHKARLDDRTEDEPTGLRSWFDRLLNPLATPSSRGAGR